MIFKEKPSNFNKQFDVAGCFIDYDGKFVLLCRHEHKSNGGKWGLPAGKLEADESLSQGLLREVFEETGLGLAEKDVSHFDSVYVRNGNLDIGWHMFSTTLDFLPDIMIQPKEHSEYRWVSPEEALDLNLIHDLEESIKMYYDTANRKNF